MIRDFSRNELLDFLEEHRACKNAVTWVEETPGSPEELWGKCEDVGYLIWLATKVEVDTRVFVGVAIDLAEAVLVCVPKKEARPRAAVGAARACLRGGMSTKDTHAAARAARAATYTAHDAAHPAAYTAHAAAHAAAHTAYAATYTTTTTHHWHAARAAAYTARAAAHAAAYTARCGGVGLATLTTLVRKKITWGDVWLELQHRPTLRPL